MWREAAILGLR